MREIKKYGIVVCSSCRDVALAVDDTIIIMVRDGKQVKNVIFGNEGLASSGRKGLGLIITSTIELSYARELGEEALKVGFGMINAPVSGSKIGAERGTLTLMVSGDEHLYTKSKPIFDAIGKNVFFFGTKQESGQCAKLANNLIAGINIPAVVEGFRFAESMGISEKTFKELLSVSTGNCWFAQNWEWTKTLWEEDNRESKSVSALFVKDLRAVIDESIIPLPLTGLAAQFWLLKMSEKKSGI